MTADSLWVITTDDFVPLAHFESSKNSTAFDPIKEKENFEKITMNKKINEWILIKKAE